MKERERGRNAARKRLYCENLFGQALVSFSKNISSTSFIMHLVPETRGTVFLASPVHLAAYRYFMRRWLFLGCKEGSTSFASIFIKSENCTFTMIDGERARLLLLHGVVDVGEIDESSRLHLCVIDASPLLDCVIISRFRLRV